MCFICNFDIQDLRDDYVLNMEAAKQAGLSDGETFTLANFSYSNSIIVERMFHHLNNTDFLGITVRYFIITSNFTSFIC